MSKFFVDLPLYIGVLTGLNNAAIKKFIIFPKAFNSY